MKSTQHNWQEQFSSWQEAFDFLGEGYQHVDTQALQQALKFLWSLPGDGADFLPRTIDVAARLKGLNVDAETLVAAILGSYNCAQHMDIPEVTQLYGSKTAKLVENVRWLNSLVVADTSQDGKTRFAGEQTEILRRMVLSMVEDVRAVLIRLAFRVQRMHLIKWLDEDERRRIARETLDLFAPLANRLGVAQLKWEMEDLAFRTLEPDAYTRIAKALEERREDRENYVQNFVSMLAQKLADESILTARIHGRPKNIYSIWMKMKRKRLEFVDLFDVRAVRVLVDTIQECYAVLGVVHSNWSHIPREFDDYIANPKENGYQSLHTAVLGIGGKAVEVQIRTQQMNEDAELGVAAHWRYKEGGVKDQRLQRNINSLRQLLESQEEGGLLESVASEVFDDRVFVFTPAGDVIDLPAGATSLDFAYQVHTEIGHRCRGAKINGRIVPLVQVLENGDQVEILTSKNSVPRRDWLNKELGYLAATRSRAKVRSWFNQQDQEQHKLDGRLIVEREMKRMRLADKPHEILLKKLRQDSLSKFYIKVGRNEIGLAQLTSAIGSLESPAEKIRSKQISRQQVSASSSTKKDICVSGVGSLLTQIATCCKPVPYDRIIGFITRGKGVSVHRMGCRNILNLSIENQSRLIDVDWGEESTQGYSVDIWLFAYDRQGLLRDVTAVLSNEKISVMSIHTQSDPQEQTAEMKLTLEVEGIEQLVTVMEKLRQLSNVLEVQRR